MGIPKVHKAISVFLCRSPINRGQTAILCSVGVEKGTRQKTATCLCVSAARVHLILKRWKKKIRARLKRQKKNKT